MTRAAGRRRRARQRDRGLDPGRPSHPDHGRVSPARKAVRHAGRDRALRRISTARGRRSPSGRFGDAVDRLERRAARSRSCADAGNAQCPPARHFACFTGRVSLRAGADHAVAIGPLGSAYVAWAASVRGGDDVPHAAAHGRRPAQRRGAAASTPSRAPPTATPASRRSPCAPTAIADLAWRASLPRRRRAEPARADPRRGEQPRRGRRGAAGRLALPGDDPFIAGHRQGEAIVAWDQLNSTPQNPDGEEVAYAVRARRARPRSAPPTTISAPDVAAGRRSRSRSTRQATRSPRLQRRARDRPGAGRPGRRVAPAARRAARSARRSRCPASRSARSASSPPGRSERVHEHSRRGRDQRLDAVSAGALRRDQRQQARIARAAGATVDDRDRRGPTSTARRHRCAAQSAAGRCP